MDERRADAERDDEGVAIVFHENLPPRRRTRSELRQELRVVEDDPADDEDA